MTCPDYHDWLSSAQDDEPFTLHMRDACTRALELAMSMCFVANFGLDHGGRTYEALSVVPQKCSGFIWTGSLLRRRLIVYKYCRNGSCTDDLLMLSQGLNPGLAAGGHRGRLALNFGLPSPGTSNFVLT